MGTVNFLEAIMGTHVDLSGLEQGLQKGEQMAEAGGKKIATSLGIGLGGLTAVTAVVGALTMALEKSISTTAEFGLEMEHLANRMGMTVSQASTLIGVMERYGISTGVAARSMQIMAMEAKQTTDALDPFETKMGRVLGTLRDVNGNALTMAQVFELARSKVSAAASDTDKLQVAQSLVGNRMAGQLLPILKMSNEEWEKQKMSVAGAMGSIEEASVAALNYKKASGELEQQFRAIELAIGSVLLPILTKFIDLMSKAAEGTRKLFGYLASPLSSDSFLKMAEAMHLVEKGTVATYEQIQKSAKAAEEHAAAERGAANALGESEKRAEQLTKLTEERVKLMEQGEKLGVATQSDRARAVQDELNQLEAQRRLLEDERSKVTGDNPDAASIRLGLETKIQKNKIEAASAVAKMAEDEYKNEEMQLKAIGALNISTELQLLEKKLGDERIVGAERLKIEGELYSKRSQFAEQAMKLERDLGIATVDQEISYRKGKAAELLGKGDVTGAGQEVVKARDLAIKQAEQQMDFMKKIRVVSLNDEIEFQKQKLNAVKGNAEEEMKVLGQIAELDKQLYTKRLELGLNYTSTILDQYKKMEDAAKGAAGGADTMTFDQARVDAQRKLIEETRQMGDIGHHGGTEEQRAGAVEWARMIQQRMEEMQVAGKNIDSTLRDAASASKDILKAASGGEEVRAPGGPNPTVGSIMSSVEGLATQGLARGSDIPRLDTSFTDLATRIRDVLLGAIPSIQSFTNAVSASGNKIAALNGVGFNPNAALGPGGGISGGGQGQGSSLETSGSTPTPSPTVGPGGTPISPSVSIGVPSLSGGANPIIDAISDLKTTLVTTLQSTSTTANDTARANAESLQEALQQARQERQTANAGINVTVDPNSGDLLVSAIEKELQQ